MFRFAFCAVMTLPTLFCGPLFADLKQEVLQAYRQRQEMVKTLAVRFNRSEFINRGSISQMMKIAPKMGDRELPVSPEVQLSAHSSNRLVLNHNKVRYENRHPLLHAQRGKMESRDAVFVTDGRQAMAIYSHQGVDHPNGWKGNNLQQDAVKAMELIPYTFAFRALDKSTSLYLIEDFEPLGQSSQINGKKCEILEMKFSDASSVLIYVDRVLAYLPRRIQSIQDSKTTSQIDIEYLPHAIAGFVPQSWTSQLLVNGQADRTNRCEASQTEINQAQADEQFTLTFPPRTVYEDRNTKQLYRVLENGAEEAVLSDGKPGSAFFHWRLLLLIIAIVGGAILLTATFLLGLKKRSARS